MKKLMVCLLAVSLSSFALAQKIATVNLEEVIRNHPQTAGDKKILEDMQQRFEKERDDLRDKAKTLEEKFFAVSQKVNDAAANEKTREKHRNEARDLLEQFNVARETLGAKVAELQQRLNNQERIFFENTMDDVRKHLGDIVEAREIDLVIDRSAERIGAPTTVVLYSSKAIDITDALIQLCKAAAERNAKASE